MSDEYNAKDILNLFANVSRGNKKYKQKKRYTLSQALTKNIPENEHVRNDSDLENTVQNCSAAFIASRSSPCTVTICKFSSWDEHTEDGCYLNRKIPENERTPKILATMPSRNSSEMKMSFEKKARNRLNLASGVVERFQLQRSVQFIWPNDTHCWVFPDLWWAHYTICW